MHPQLGIHELLSARWSHVSFSSEPIGDDILTALLEAARWSPSCFNAQPWRFVIGRHGTEAHARIRSTLVPKNAAWATHDTGMASMSLAIEATARGLFIHFMGGFDAAKARQLLAKETKTRTRKPLAEVFTEGVFFSGAK